MSVAGGYQKGILVSIGVYMLELCTVVRLGVRCRHEAMERYRGG